MAVAWWVYEISHRPLDLGLVGLVQFLPGLLLFLFSGHVADRVDRRKILICCYSGYGLSSALLVSMSLYGIRTVYPIYVVALLLGVIRAFNVPAGQAFLPQLVPAEQFQSAVAWAATVYQAATILGPAAGGIIYAISKGPTLVYVVAFCAFSGAVVSALSIEARHKPRSPKDIDLRSTLAGLRYIWREKMVLGAISLDLFAVLLGGAVALLPVYAKEILHTGPWGLGILRSAPGVGAGLMGIAVAHWPLRRRAGATMLWCVAGFGIFIIVFGLSRNLALSLIALVLVGASDTISVVVRHTLVQVSTPDEMRGRVSSVNMIFIGASNELGQFESGLTAQWFGAVPAVILGGLGTLLIVGLWAVGFPELRRVDQLARQNN